MRESWGQLLKKVACTIVKVQTCKCINQFVYLPWYRPLLIIVHIDIVYMVYTLMFNLFNVSSSMAYNCECRVNYSQYFCIRCVVQTSSNLGAAFIDVQIHRYIFGAGYTKTCGPFARGLLYINTIVQCNWLPPVTLFLCIVVIQHALLGYRCVLLGSHAMNRHKEGCALP